MYVDKKTFIVSENRGLFIWFEPWAVGYCFVPSSILQLQATSDFEGELYIEETPESVSVYGWVGSTLIVSVNDTQVVAFDNPVPGGLSPQQMKSLFGPPPIPTHEERQWIERRRWWRFWS